MVIWAETLPTGFARIVNESAGRIKVNTKQFLTTVPGMTGISGEYNV